MNTVGQPEKPVQDAVVSFFQDTLDYDYLGNWIDRQDNRNIEESYLRAFLGRQGYDSGLINRALHELSRVAGDQSRSLYDINKEVYGLASLWCKGEGRRWRADQDHMADRLAAPRAQSLCHCGRSHCSCC